jgi:hypothetical protein
MDVETGIEKAAARGATPAGPRLDQKPRPLGKLAAFSWRSFARRVKHIGSGMLGHFWASARRFRVPLHVFVDCKCKVRGDHLYGGTGRVSSPPCATLTRGK